MDFPCIHLTVLPFFLSAQTQTSIEAAAGALERTRAIYNSFLEFFALLAAMFRKEELRCYWLNVLELPLKQLMVSGGDHSTDYDASRFSFEKSWDNNPNTFFHAQLNGWAKYKIPMSTVEMVRLQNRGACCGEHFCCYVKIF